MTTLIGTGCLHNQVGTCGEDDGACPGLCGNGVVEAGSGEQCDDGNTRPGDGCDSACHVECNREAFSFCDPDAHTCCPDDWGMETVCRDLTFSTTVCIRACTRTSDCFWGFACREGRCDFVPCGPGYPDAVLDHPCQLDEGTFGWCIILWPRSDPEEPGVGSCSDFGSLAQNEDCLLEFRNRSENWCDYCDDDAPSLMGVCRHFCNWEDAYSDAIYGTASQVRPCPPGTICWGRSVLDASGLHQPTFSTCRDVAETPACSLVTDQLLADPARTCADLLDSGRCRPVEIFDGPTLGQLVGQCQTGPEATPGLTPWDPCDPAADVCPAGSVCEAEDFFGAGAGQERCLPYCDAAHHDGAVASCFELGIDPGETGGATPICTSLSVAYEPLDIDPTRLGYCALPPLAP